MEDLEIPKYHKNTGSNKSKSLKKSKHKHQYAACKFLIHTNWSWRKDPLIERGTYCTICGKIGSRQSLFTIDKAEAWDRENPNPPVFELQGFRAENVFEKNKKL